MHDQPTVFQDGNGGALKLIACLLPRDLTWLEFGDCAILASVLLSGPSYFLAVKKQFPLQCGCREFSHERLSLHERRYKLYLDVLIFFFH